MFAFSTEGIVAVTAGAPDLDGLLTAAGGRLETHRNDERRFVRPDEDGDRRNVGAARPSEYRNRRVTHHDQPREVPDPERSEADKPMMVRQRNRGHDANEVDRDSVHATPAGPVRTDHP